MIKRYYTEIKKFFSMKANNKKLLFHLFFSALLRSISLLIIPLTASMIIEYTNVADFKMSIISALLFLSSSCFYVLCHHYNYVAYANNSIFTHNKLQELILKKVTLYDENFTKNMSTSYIVNTAFNDVGKVMQIPDLTFDAITEFIGMLVAVVVLIKVNIFIGLIALILSILSIYALGKNTKKRDYYLANQRKQQDNVSGLMGQVLDGGKEIKSFNMKEDLNTYLENYKKLRRKNYFKKRIYDDNIAVVIPTILGTGKIAVYLIMIFLILNGYYEVATLVLVVGYYENIQAKYAKFYSCIN
ncbi:MAG: hypothetical protein K2I70_01395, partial [Bacilli bacterium]|nr:hypothetical protein [Bacilli bacterium]